MLVLGSVANAQTDGSYSASIAITNNQTVNPTPPQVGVTPSATASVITQAKGSTPYRSDQQASSTVDTKYRQQTTYRSTFSPFGSDTEDSEQKNDASTPTGTPRQTDDQWTSQEAYYRYEDSIRRSSVYQYPTTSSGAGALFLSTLSPLGDGRYKRDFAMAAIISRQNNLCISVTVAHAFSGDAIIAVAPWSGEGSFQDEQSAEILRTYPDQDIAFIKHNCPSSFYAAPAKYRERVPLMTRLFAFGQPSERLGVVTDGIVSAYWSMPDNGQTIMLSSLQAVHGFSGGPVYTEDGKFAGMVIGRMASEVGYAYIVPRETIWSLLDSVMPAPAASYVLSGPPNNIEFKSIQ